MLVVFFCSRVGAQELKSHVMTKKILASRDTIHLEKTSINCSSFAIFNSKKIIINAALYVVNCQSGTLLFTEKYPFTSDSLTVKYLKYPLFLTKEYRIYDNSRIVKNEIGQNKLYAISNDAFTKFVTFDGLNTSGSITRGITIGNNQNAVVNSNLDLKITGKISDKISLRASIQDSNIPLKEGGYSQKLDEFDQIFLELFSDKWAIRGGDLFLENRKSKFLNFNKKVQGIAANFDFGATENKTNIFASAALVRGQYAKSAFTGQEGNQGPYKLKGTNGELYVLVISGSERVFVNGILLKRGEDKDYIIDYNAGEIKFTSLFPITSEMRISIEYQYSDRNYTRFVSYFGATHEQKNWSVGSYFYSESDLKNQPLQQNLSVEQVSVLAQAGDNTALMNAPSAYEDNYSANKILYKKKILNAVTVFEYTSNTTDVLYNVKFNFVGEHLGNYVMKDTLAIGKIYRYVPPNAGILQGKYEPLTKLVAPTKIQIATVVGKFNPSDKTAIDFELGISNSDLNLFSPLDDANNQGIAGKINVKKRIFSGKWLVDAFTNYQFIQKDFKTIERLFNIEFNRDWNITTVSGNQSLLVTGLSFDLPKKGQFTYQFEKLDFTNSFSGTRHVANVLFGFKRWNLQNQGSFLSSSGTLNESKFFRNQLQARYHFKNNWIGTSLRLEDNKQRNSTTNVFSNLSQKFTEWGTLLGRGDSTKVFIEFGFLNRKNDSVQNGLLQRVNASNSYYMKSKLFENDRSDLAVFINYRILDFIDVSRGKESSLNSRLLYNTRFFNQLLQTTTTYETTSGTIPQQEFTYLEVEPSRGIYMWNDYNGNGIQELTEFEIAPFPDLARFIRVFLPNQIFIKTHQNKFSESVTINTNQWQNATGIKKLASHFYNQTSFLIDRKIERKGANFDLNPFSNEEENQLGLSNSFRNSLFFNRGKQNHSVTFTVLKNHSKNLLSIGSLENNNNSNQIQYQHLVKQSWLINLSGKTGKSSTEVKGFTARNYQIKYCQIAPKIAYLFSRNTSWDFFYEFENKVNTIGELESLKQTRLGTSFIFSSEKKLTMNGEFSLYNNAFEGNSQSPVAFQMLEGLQPGKNITWRLMVQKNLTQFLDINLNYQGRKSETSETIHTGNVQLRAYF